MLLMFVRLISGTEKLFSSRVQKVVSCTEQTWSLKNLQPIRIVVLLSDLYSVPFNVSDSGLLNFSFTSFPDIRELRYLMMRMPNTSMFLLGLSRVKPKRG